VCAVATLAAFQRNGKVVRDVTAGSLLKMRGLCAAALLQLPLVLVRLFLQLVIRPLAA